jgi:hypothetical protein
MARPSFFAPLMAWIRQGSKEFGQAIPATRDSIRVVEEPNTLGNPTPQMQTFEAGSLRDRNILDRYDSRTYDRDDRDHGIER